MLQGSALGNAGYSLDETLVDAHLKAIPCLGTLTARGLAGGDLQNLGGKADGALDAQVLALGALDQLGAHLLQGLDLAGGKLVDGTCQSSPWSTCNATSTADVR